MSLLLQQRLVLQTRVSVSTADGDAVTSVAEVRDLLPVAYFVTDC